MANFDRDARRLCVVPLNLNDTYPNVCGRGKSAFYSEYSRECVNERPLCSPLQPAVVNLLASSESRLQAARLMT